MYLRPQPNVKQVGLLRLPKSNVAMPQFTWDPASFWKRGFSGICSEQRRYAILSMCQCPCHASFGDELNPHPPEGMDAGVLKWWVLVKIRHAMIPPKLGQNWFAGYEHWAWFFSFPDMFLRMYVCMYVMRCMYVHMCPCTYIYIYIHM